MLPLAPTCIVFTGWFNTGMPGLLLLSEVMVMFVFVDEKKAEGRSLDAVAIILKL